MIHKLTLTNFYSFRESGAIDLRAAENAPVSPERLIAPSVKSAHRYPRVIGVYGPNASGKSTVLKAISFINFLVAHSFSLPATERFPCYRFAAEECAKKPIEIEIEFDAPVDLTDSADDAERCDYVYKVIMGGDGETPNRIEYESLFAHRPNSVRRVKLFERNVDGVQSGARSFNLQGIIAPLKKILRPQASLLSTLIQLGHDDAVGLSSVLKAIYANIFMQFFSPSEGILAERYLADATLRADFNKYIARLDLGITEMSVTAPPNDRSYPEVTYFHKGLNRALLSSSESQGTRQFFRIFPMIYDALASGGVAIIDELDSSIHTLLMPEIIRWFWDPNKNKRNAQLWFTCQNPYMLSHLIKEEILFTEKDGSGNSAVFGLGDMRSVKRDENYMKKYLGGAYGAVPHFG